MATDDVYSGRSRKCKGLDDDTTHLDVALMTVGRQCPLSNLKGVYIGRPWAYPSCLTWLVGGLTQQEVYLTPDCYKKTFISQL